MGSVMAIRPSRRAGKRAGLFVAVLVLLCLNAASGMCGDWPQFRGPARDGKSTDTGLMKQWPADGPEMVWSYGELGHGYSSVAVADGRIYTTGLEGRNAVMYVFDQKGQLLWKKPYGQGWTRSTPGARGTPTIDDGLAYVMTGNGEIACFDAKSGDQKWAVDLKRQYRAKIISWGMVESLLIDGDNLICTPGGTVAVVALNKKTGQEVWKCTDISDASAYCSPIIVKRGNRRLIVTLMANAFIGVDADKAKLLWRHPRDVSWKIHAVSPVYDDGRVFITAGYGGNRSELFELSANGDGITKKPCDRALDCHHGGVIALNGHVYGASDKNSRGSWICQSMATGQVVATTPAVKKGSIAYADGMFYGYGENGTVGLIDPSPKDFKMVSSFRITKGAKQHWAHPAIANGTLYIRHGAFLMAFDVKAK